MVNVRTVGAQLLVSADGGLTWTPWNGSGSGSGGTSAADGAAYTAGVTAGTAAMAARDDADTQVADGKVGVLRGTAHRALHVNLRDNAGVEVTALQSLNTTTGATTDAAVTGDNTGTVSAKLRGLSKIVADVWDSVGHTLKISGSLATTPPAAGTPDRKSVV